MLTRLGFFLFLGKWIPIHGKLYHFSQERITFAKAKATCEYNDGKLFEPKTEYINNDIASRVRDLEYLHKIYLEKEGIHARIEKIYGL